ncbi:MAG: 5'-nucleotidase C-terminal domain-containing protein [Bacillota bacterium]
MSKVNNTKAIIFTVTLLSVMVMLIAGTIFYVYKDPVISETAASEQTVETTAETKAVREKRISVYGTSDIQGKLIDSSSGDKMTYQYRLAYMAKTFSDARTSGDYDDVLLVDAGDIYKGDPISNLSEGAALRAAFDKMGYDAVTLGTGDFEWDATRFATDGSATIPSYELGEFTGNPTIPVIASNLYNTSNKSRSLFTKDYVIVEKAGARIALIGYISDVSSQVVSNNMDQFEIHEDLAELAKRVKEIKAAENPLITVVVAHCAADTVAAAMDPADVDLVVGGLTNSGVYGNTENGVAYMQAESDAKGYAHATFVLKSDGTVKIEYMTYVSIMDSAEALYDTSANSENFDPDVLAISRTAVDSTSDAMNEALGYIDANVERSAIISGRTTTAGNFLTGLILESMKGQGVVAAFHNCGGMNKDLITPDGGLYQVSAGDIYAVASQDYALLVYELTGEELAKQIANGFANGDYGDQMSGLTFEYKNNGTEEEPVIEVVSITLSDGTKVDVKDQKTKYKVCITNYCAKVPGSVFEGKKPLKDEKDAPIDNQAIIKVLRSRKSGGDVHIPTDNKPRGTVAAETTGN